MLPPNYKLWRKPWSPRGQVSPCVSSKGRDLALPKGLVNSWLVFSLDKPNRRFPSSDSLNLAVKVLSFWKSYWSWRRHYHISTYLFAPSPLINALITQRRGKGRGRVVDLAGRREKSGTSVLYLLWGWKEAFVFLPCIFQVPLRKRSWENDVWFLCVALTQEQGGALSVNVIYHFCMDVSKEREYIRFAGFWMDFFWDL